MRLLTCRLKGTKANKAKTETQIQNKTAQIHKTKTLNKQNDDDDDSNNSYNNNARKQSLYKSKYLLK